MPLGPVRKCAKCVLHLKRRGPCPEPCSLCVDNTRCSNALPQTNLVRDKGVPKTPSEGQVREDAFESGSASGERKSPESKAFQTPESKNRPRRHAENALRGVVPNLPAENPEPVLSHVVACCLFRVWQPASPCRV